MNKLLIAVALTVLTLETFSQTSTQLPVVPGARIGPYVSGLLNFSSPDVNIWQSYPTTSAFEQYRNDTVAFTAGSTKLALGGGVVAMFPLNRMWRIGGRVGVNWLNGSSTFNQSVGQDSALNHATSSSQILIEVSPSLEIHDLFSIPLYVLAGLEFGFPISSTYDQSSDVQFQGQTAISGPSTPSTDIPSTSVRSAVMVGAGYTIELSKNVWLQPEVSYRLPLTNVTSAEGFSPWKVSQLRFGVNLTFGLGADETQPEPDQRRASARFDPVTALDNNGREYEVQSLMIEDVTYTEMFPLVPYVFFPAGGSTPDESAQNTQYGSEKGEFIPEKLELDAMEVNRNLLNIVGSRMKKIPHSTLTITGTIDGMKEDAKGSTAAKRAEWAKQYLISAFGIEPDRISARGVGTPSKPSSTTDPEGIEENRRAELTSNVPDILEPLVITADNQRIASPSVVMFHPVVENADSVKKWIVSITQAGRPLRELSGSGTPKSVTWSIKPNELSTTQVPVDFVFTATTSDGQQVEANGSMPVDYLSSVRKKTENLPDRTIDKYSLILFDFDKATLNEDNKRVLERMVLPAIKANSKVSIIGYTDRIGSEDHNKKLSKDRAETVKSFLQSRATDAKYTAMGVGESSEIYPNGSPAGRQLSRTVQVIIETKK